MSTWGSGLLENDSAQDFLDEIAALDQRDRYERISQVLNSVADDPAVVMKQVVPEEVIAAAVIVASSLVTDSSYEWATAVTDMRNGGLIAREAQGLARVALRALHSVVGDEHGWWTEGWVLESDRQHAGRQIQELISVLDRQAALASINRVVSCDQ